MPEAATGELSWGREGGGFSIFFQTFNLHIVFFNVISSEKSLSILVFIIQRSPRTFAVVAQLLNWKAPKKKSPLHLIGASFEIGPKHLRNNNQIKIVAQKRATRVCFLL